jgi:hypothetical protein
MMQGPLLPGNLPATAEKTAPELENRGQQENCSRTTALGAALVRDPS